MFHVRHCWVGEGEGDTLTQAEVRRGHSAVAATVQWQTTQCIGVSAQQHNTIEYNLHSLLMSENQIVRGEKESKLFIFVSKAVIIQVGNGFRTNYVTSIKSENCDSD